MITRIKEIHWWDPKSRTDAVTYKVFIDHMGQTELKYFTDKKELDAFIKKQTPKGKENGSKTTPKSSSNSS